MDEPSIKHLGFIQQVISRLAQNSFTYKGWAITLVAAIFILWGRDSGPQFLLIALLPAMTFWGLDGYYLRQERLFRKHYDYVREAAIQGTRIDSFSMDTTMHNTKVPSWWHTCWSKTIGWLYAPIVLIIIVITSFTYIYSDC